MAKRKRKSKAIELNKELLAIKVVPEELKTADKVIEKIKGKKLKPKHKLSVKYKAAIKNYKTAATRYKRAVTLLKKHEQILNRLNKKLFTEPGGEQPPQN